MDIKKYLFLFIILICFFCPVLINSIQTISTITNAKYLEKITQGINEEKTSNNCFNLTFALVAKYKQKEISSRFTVIHSILAFIFCLDIIDGVYLKKKFFHRVKPNEK